MTLTLSSTQKAGFEPARPAAEMPASGGAAGGFAARLQEQMQPAVPDTMLQAAPSPEPRSPEAAPPPANAAPSPDDEDAVTRQARRGTPPARPRQAVPAQRSEAAQAEQRAVAPADAAAAAAAAEAGTDAQAGADVAGRPAARGAKGTDAQDPAAAVNWMLQMITARPQADARGAGQALEAGEAGPATLARTVRSRGQAADARDAAAERAAERATDAAAQLGQAAQATEWQAEAGQAFAAAGPALPQAQLRSAAPELTAAHVAALAQPDAAGAAAPSAQVHVKLDAPVQSPEFREALAAQISTFARDGVQEAVLQLNPADMGPITVQIAMDGTQARIDFQAVQSSTRELIEGSLASLASALHGEGLTLSGGSVGDQRAPGQQHEAPRGGRDTRHAAGEAAAPTGGTAARPAAPRGDRAVDLYA
jgi:flagellar hook-length control protein FliK